MDYPENQYLKGTIKSPLEKGDQYVDFEAYNQDRQIVKLSEVLANNPVILLWTWSRASGMRAKYLQEIAKIIPIAEGAGYKIISINRENYPKLKGEQSEWGLNNLIAIDDDSITDYKISMTYTGNNPFYAKSCFFAIDTSGLIVEKLRMTEATDMDLFFGLLEKYIREGNI